MTEFSKLLKASRRRANLTQLELAQKVGLDHSYISKIERGYNLPSRDKVLAIIDTLGVTEANERAYFLLAAGYAGFGDIKLDDGKSSNEAKHDQSEPNTSRGVYESPLSISSVDILISSLEATEKNLEAAIHGLRTVRELVTKIF